MSDWKDTEELERSMGKILALTTTTQFSLTIDEGTDLETRISFNMPESQCSLARKAYSIDYDCKQLTADPTSYLNSLSAAQEKYLEEIRGQVHEGYDEFNAFVGFNSQLKTILELIPEGKEKQIMGVAKALIAAQGLIKGQNFKAMLQELTDLNYSKMQTQMIVERFFDYGKGFLEKSQKECDGKLKAEDRKKLEDCLETAKKIDYICGRVVDTTKKEIAEIKELRDGIYSPKPAATE